MRRVLVTGMSGTGKSTVLQELGRRGYDIVDTDSDVWSQWVTLPDGSRDWIWRDPQMLRLLAQPRDRPLFVAGCRSNQGRFYSQFDAVVLLTAPADVISERIANRTTNRYGKTATERAQVLEHLATVEPRLRRTSSHEFDATAPLPAVVGQLEDIAREAEPGPPRVTR
jgi:shikimate kinase